MFLKARFLWSGDNNMISSHIKNNNNNNINNNNNKMDLAPTPNEGIDYEWCGALVPRNEAKQQEDDLAPTPNQGVDSKRYAALVLRSEAVISNYAGLPPSLNGASSSSDKVVRRVHSSLIIKYVYDSEVVTFNVSDVHNINHV